MSYSHPGAIRYINCVTSVMIVFLKKAHQSFYKSSVDMATNVDSCRLVSFQTDSLGLPPQNWPSSQVFRMHVTIPFPLTVCVSTLQT